MKTWLNVPPSEEEVTRAFDKLAAFKPDPASWGFFFRDDPPPPAFGRGIFCWFPSKDELCAFLVRFPLMWASSEPEDDEELAAIVRTAAKEIRGIIAHFPRSASASESIGALRNDINCALGSFGRFEWFGTLELLITEDDQFALGVRCEFWREYASERSPESEAFRPSPIPIERRKDFVEFTRYYGC